MAHTRVADTLADAAQKATFDNHWAYGRRFIEGGFTLSQLSNAADGSGRLE